MQIVQTPDILFIIHYSQAEGHLDLGFFFPWNVSDNLYSKFT